MADESAAAAKDAFAAVFEASMSLGTEITKSVTKEVSDSVTREVTTSFTKETASLLLKIGSHNSLLVAFAAGVVTAGAATLGAFYYLKQSESDSATKKGLESTDETGKVVRKVDFITGGSIIVKLSCYTLQSIVQFVKDLKENKIKRRLEEEFKKIGFDHELEVTIVHAQEVFQREYTTR